MDHARLLGGTGGISSLLNSWEIKGKSSALQSPALGFTVLGWGQQPTGKRGVDWLFKMGLGGINPKITGSREGMLIVFGCLCRQVGFVLIYLHGGTSPGSAQSENVALQEVLWG